MRTLIAVWLVLPLACSGSGGGAAGNDAGGTGGSEGGRNGQTTTPASDGAPSKPLPGQKRVFVTSASYGGMLKVEGRGADGLTGGDNLCQVAAEAGLLGGNWKAWLSSGLPGGTPAHATDRIADVGPWYLLDGKRAFNNKANLMTAPLVPIDVDENGRTVPLFSDVWTGTSSGGTWSGRDCGEWTAGFSGSFATIGNANSGTKDWTDHVSADCGTDRRLYCIEQ